MNEKEKVAQNKKDKQKEELWNEYKFPKELGGLTYRVRRFMPYHVYCDMLTAESQGNRGAVMSIILLNMVLKPKITEEMLAMDDLEDDGIKYVILSNKIEKGLDLSMLRIEELQKKVVRL